MLFMAKYMADKVWGGLKAVIPERMGLGGVYIGERQTL